jgi:hypothetical protein
MDDCPSCVGLSKPIKSTNPDQYRELVRQLIEMVNRNLLLLVRADCPLEDILGPVWPGDSLSHDLQCTACGRGFNYTPIRIMGG